MTVQLHITVGDHGRLADTIYEQLVEAIRSGQLREGDPLPPTRHLATQLRVSRSTVTAAYDRLAGSGYVTAHVGSGTFVGTKRPDASAEQFSSHAPKAVWLKSQSWWDSRPRPYSFPSAEFDFTSGLPDVSLFPHEAWRRLMSRQFRAASMRRGVYTHPAGHQQLREAIAHHLGVTRAIRTTAADITVVNGTQQALDILTRTIVAPGQNVAMEDPGYGMALRTFAVLGTSCQLRPRRQRGAAGRPTA